MELIMNKFIKFLKSFRLSQILTIFLAGSLLVISTACSQGNMAQSGGKAYTDTAKKAMSDTYDDYDANQPFVGGMNGYNDDPRYNAETQSKAKELVDTAKSRQQNNLDNYFEDISDRAQNKIDEATDNISDIPQSLQAKKDEAVENIQQRANTLKENVKNAPEQAKQVFDEATNTAQNALEDAAQATKNRTQDIKENIRDLT